MRIYHLPFAICRLHGNRIYVVTSIWYQPMHIFSFHFIIIRKGMKLKETKRNKMQISWPWYAIVGLNFIFLKLKFKLFSFIVFNVWSGGGGEWQREIVKVFGIASHFFLLGRNFFSSFSNFSYRKWQNQLWINIKIFVMTFKTFCGFSVRFFLFCSFHNVVPTKMTSLTKLTFFLRIHLHWEHTKKNSPGRGIMSRGMVTQIPNTNSNFK